MPPNRKAEGAIRRAQLLTTFGPGAMMDLPRHAVLVGGLDFWSKGGEIIAEPRLSAKLATLLGVDTLELRTPPAADDTPGAPQTGVTVFEFPNWFITQQSQPEPAKAGVRFRFLLHASALTQGAYIDDDRKRQPVVPVRFVRACRAGHIGDIDWYTFTHGGACKCAAAGRRLRLQERGTSGDLTEMWVVCECGREQSIRAAAEMNSRSLGHCDGARPWLGPYATQKCQELNRLLIRSASNAYFPELMSAISLPERGERIRQCVDAAWPFVKEAESLDDIRHERKKADVRDALQDVSDEEVWAELEARRHGAGAADKKVKEAELETLTTAQEQWGEDQPHGVFFARTLPEKEWRRDWMNAVDRVVLVHRLREVVAQAGFTRFEPAGADMEGELDLGARRAELAREIRWLPAYENRGEGVFIQFKREAIHAWLARPQVTSRAAVLMRAFTTWSKERRVHFEFPGAPYYLLHSLAHLLITSIALECGYPASSLRERIYALPQLGFGILLYTGGPDAEGTLGGLVEVGRGIHDVIQRALRLAQLCSNDPVCAQHDPASSHEHRFLHGAACHGCLLISETSCEQHNDFLDRTLLAPTLSATGAEFFAAPPALP